MLACMVNDRASLVALLDFAGDQLNFELRGHKGDKVIDLGMPVRRTAEFYAIQYNAYQVVEEMVGRGLLDLRQVDKAEGMNAVLFAAHFNSRSSLRYLVGASPEAAMEALVSLCPTREGTIERLCNTMEGVANVARLEELSKFDRRFIELVELMEMTASESEDMRGSWDRDSSKQG